MVPIPLIGPSYQSRELPLSAQVSKGLFPEINPEARNVISLHAFPGLKPKSTGTGTGRGLHIMAEVLYGVYGNTLYEIDSNGGRISRGTIDGERICGFADNGDQMFIVTGGPYYLYTAATTTLEVCTDPDLVNPTTVGYLNSQFIFDNNSGISDKGDFVTSQVSTALTASNIVNTADRARANAHPDDITRLVIANEQVIFFGTEGIDPWWNSGSGNPPFDQIKGAFRPYGLAGRDAIDKSDEFIYFLDEHRVPRRMYGLQVLSIGNPALGAEWADYTRVDDCVVYTFTLDHQNFAQFNFPTANQSWLYHEASNSWTELGFGTGAQRHRGASYAFAYGKNFVQDHSNGSLYELDFKTYTDNGEVIQRKRATATIHGGLYGAPGKELYFNEVQFVVQTGEGIPVGQGSDPQLMVRHSDDGGRTYSAEEHHPLGVGGSFYTRVTLYSDGAAYERIYELSCSDPVPFTLIDAQADLSIGI